MNCILTSWNKELRQDYLEMLKYLKKDNLTRLEKFTKELDEKYIRSFYGKEFIEKLRIRKKNYK